MRPRNRPQSLSQSLPDLHPSDQIAIKSYAQRVGSVLRTGSVKLDTGIPYIDMVFGGLPVGIHAIAGHYSSGKTSLGLHMAAEAQRQGLVPLICDPCSILRKEEMARAGLKLSETGYTNGDDEDVLKILNDKVFRFAFIDLPGTLVQSRDFMRELSRSTVSKELFVVMATSMRVGVDEKTQVISDRRIIRPYLTTSLAIKRYQNDRKGPLTIRCGFGMYRGLVTKRYQLFNILIQNFKVNSDLNLIEVLIGTGDITVLRGHFTINGKRIPVGQPLKPSDRDYLRGLLQARRDNLGTFGLKT